MLRMLIPSAAVAALLVMPAFAGPKTAKAKDNCEGKACCKPAATAKKADAKKVEAKKAAVKTSNPAKSSAKKS